MKLIMLLIGMILISLSLYYLFKKHTKFNKKATVILMLCGILILILYSINWKLMSFEILYYLFQTILIGVLILIKIIPYMFIREKAKEDEDI